MAVDLDGAVLFVAGAAMVLVAAVILSARPASGVHRALAALVGARGVAHMLPQASDDPAWVLAALHVQPYFTLAAVPLAFYAMYAFSRPEGAYRSHAGWLAFAGVAALDLAYAFDHGLLHTVVPGAAEVGALRAAEGYRFAAFGPLAVVASSVGLVLGLLALRLALEYRQRPDGRDSTLLLLVSGAFMVGALFDGASRLASLSALLDHPGDFPWLPWGWAVAVLPSLALAPGLLAALVLLSGRVDPRPLQRTEDILLLVGAFALLTGFARLVLPADSDVAGSPFVLVVMGAWRLAMPLLVGYAMVRHAHAHGQASSHGLAASPFDAAPAR